MKALISYSDWLLLNRGEIRPEIGDKIVVIYDYYREAQIKKIFGSEFELKLQLSDDRYDWKYLNNCYYEIDYNPNEAEEVKDIFEEPEDIFSKHIGSSFFSKEYGD